MLKKNVILFYFRIFNITIFYTNIDINYHDNNSDFDGFPRITSFELFHNFYNTLLSEYFKINECIHYTF